MLNRLSKFYLLYFCLLVLGTLKSQYDTTHYIPYLADLTGESSSMANLEYDDSSYNGAYFMFSTFEAGTTNVIVYKRKTSGTGWETETSFTISPGDPYVWEPSTKEVQKFFRYSKFNNKNQLIISYDKKWLKTGIHGLKIVADNNIYVRTVLQPDNNNGGDKKWGAGTNTHGAAFSSKGISRGAGTEFIPHIFIPKIKQKP